MLNDTSPTTSGLEHVDTDARVGAHLSTLIVLSNSDVYETLCCFSQNGDDRLTERDLQKLECVEKFTAKRIDMQKYQRVKI